jgi:hypothetical protein
VVFLLKTIYSINMRRGEKITICLLVGTALTLGARAVVNDTADHQPATTEDNSYDAIWLRNVFDLKPPPPPVVELAKTNEPPPNVHLTGITTIFGNPRALFMVQKKQEPGKPPSKEESYILREGQRQDVLEVLQINPTAQTVKIKVDDVVSTITFETNHPSGPGASNMAGGAAPHQNYERPPGLEHAFRNNPGMALPGRSMRSAENSYAPQQANYGQSGYQGGSGYGYGASGSTFGGGAAINTGGSAGTSIPNSLFNQTPTQPTQASQAAAVPALTPDEQAAIMAVNQVAHQNEIQAGTYPPLPPIPGLPSSSSESSSENTGNTSGSSTTGSSLGSRSSGTLAQ